jgi:putative Mg2+ transporter-C (MgtC) family protein
MAVLNYLHQFNFVSVVFRLILAMAACGTIGYGRTKRSKTAGFRTYMLTGLGSSMSIMLALYNYEMMNTVWADTVSAVGMKFDASRFSAAVIGGIGFIAAGSIVSTSHHQVKGLTTATGLFASVCMGFACGAGYYECVILAAALIMLALNVMQPLERRVKRRWRNITLFVQYEDIRNIDDITAAIKNNGAEIQEIEIEQLERKGDILPSAILNLRLGKENPSHSDMMSAIAELPGVFAIEELIS